MTVGVRLRCQREGPRGTPQPRPDPIDPITRPMRGSSDRPLSLLRGRLYGRFLHLGGYGPGLSHGGLSPSSLIAISMFAPPPTGGHTGLRLTQAQGHPVYLPGGLHGCHPGGGGHRLHESYDDGKTPP
jgi:hypothetical protein